MVFGNISNHKFLLNFKKYRYLLLELIKKDIKLTYRRSFLGVFWIFLSPLLYTIVLTIVFSTFFDRMIENYPVYLLSGRLVFDFFSGGTKTAMKSIKSAGIIKRIYVPKYIYPLASVIGKYITFLITLIILGALVIITGVTLTWNVFLIIIPFILAFFLVLGIGLTLATVVIFFRDVQHLWSVFLSLLMWCSAIFYPASIIPDKFRFLLDYNPVFHLIDMVRNSVLFGIPSAPFQILFVLGITVFFLILGIILLYKYQDKFILYI